MNWNDLLLRLRALIFRKRIETELDEELRFHLVMQTRKNVAAGMSASEAERLARVQFGGIEPVREECREKRGTQWIETSLQDIRYAVRGFRRSPTFVLTVVATIALGLGINTTLFTIFNAYVLRPIAVRDSHSLYRYTWTNRSGAGHSFSWPEFEAFRQHNPAFSEIIGLNSLFARVEGHPLTGELVTGNYFQMLGVSAARGRTLRPEDSSVPGAEPVMVLSYLAWKNKFGGDPDILGRKFVIRGHPLEVVGIAKPEFTGLGETPRDFWVPLTMAGQLEEGPDLFGATHPNRLDVIGRLKPRFTTGQAEAALTAWARQTTADRPDAEKAIGTLLQSRATKVPLTPAVLAFFSPILVAFALILLIACANVANLMLARAMARQREIGVRLSLGATRTRLIRQLLMESVLLAVPSAIVGFAISQATIQLGVKLLFATLPAEFAEFVTIVPLPPDMRVFGFMLAAALVSALLFGLAPALQSTRSNVMQAAKGDFTSDFRPARLRNALVLGQITVCVLLLICAGMMLRGIGRMDKADVGFETRGVITVEFQDKFRARIISQLTQEPTVQSLAAVQSSPLNGALPRVPIIAGEREGTLSAWYNFASPEYFDLLGIRILRGRNFTQDEAASRAPVAIVSRKTAQRLWPNQDALGQSIRIIPPPHTPREARIRRYSEVRVIGVAADIVSCCLSVGPDPTCVYLPVTPAAEGTTLLVWVHGDDELARQKLDAALAKISPGAVDQIHRLQEFRAAGVYPFRAAAWICSALGGLALLLTMSAVYGVLSYLVTQRTKEIGIRVALGATIGGVTGLVLKQSMRTAVIGVVLGVLLALGVSRLVASHLFMLNIFDGTAYGAGIGVVLASSAAAAYFPSRRAARIDPAITLRYD